LINISKSFSVQMLPRMFIWAAPIRPRSAIPCN